MNWLTGGLGEGLTARLPFVLEPERTVHNSEIIQVANKGSTDQFCTLRADMSSSFASC